MADTGAPIHVRISDVPEKTITNVQPATGLRPPKADPGQSQTGRLLNGLGLHQPGQDHRYQQTVAVQMQQYSVATEAVPLNAAKQ